MPQTLQPHGSGRAALQLTGSGSKGSATTASWRSPTSASKVSSSSSKSTGNRRRPESAEINDERRPAAAHPGRLLRIWMKFVNKP